MLKFQEIIVLIFDVAMSSGTRQERDWKDTQTILKYLHEGTPSLLMSVYKASSLEYS